MHDGTVLDGTLLCRMGRAATGRDGMGCNARGREGRGWMSARAGKRETPSPAATRGEPMKPHPERGIALGEIHARPIPAIEPGRVVLHHAFMSDGGSAVSHAVLADLCRTRGESAPQENARYHDLAWGRGRLRWERHSEFSTFAWEGPAPARFQGPITGHPFGAGFSQPGMLISATRVEIRRQTRASLAMLDRFDRESLCVTVLHGGQSLLATDFRQDGDGMTVFLMLVKDMSPTRIGHFVKAVIELETYRTLSMLGLPLAQKLSGRLARFEAELARLTQEMRKSEPDSMQMLLDQITSLAGELEADAASSLFRFGATRAYGDIVHERMEMLAGEAMPGYRRIARFLDLRLAPALRTCRSVEERQANLSQKLSRTANLLRTRVEVEIEEQNRSLLDSMNRRARLQLRLQQTVEGLSVAAISYYVVGLFYYLAQALEHYLPAGISPKAAAGAFVPIAILGIWFTVRRIRHHHGEDD